MSELNDDKAKCFNCEDVFDKVDLYKHDGKNYCDSCEGELFFCCESCSDSGNLDDAKSTNDGIFCQECFDKKYFTCNDCDRVRNQDERYSDDHDNLICEICYENNYFYCEGCDSTCHSDNYSEDSRCLDCRPTEDDTNSIKDYSYQPTYSLHKMPWENTLYLGIELEVNIPSTITKKDMAEKFMEFLKGKGWADYLYLKDDCSIGHGFEIVSHPFTLQAKHKKINWYVIMNWLKKHGCSSYKSGKCGLHIHVSKKELSIETQGKIRLFINNNQVKCKEFSKRKDFHYCQYENYSIGQYNYDLKTSADRLRPITQAGRGAVNLYTNKPTIEYRLFRGTLDYKRFMASLQFAEAVTMFCKENSALGVSNSNSWVCFKTYLRQSARYSHLVKYLQKAGI